MKFAFEREPIKRLTSFGRDRSTNVGTERIIFNIEFVDIDLYKLNIWKFMWPNPEESWPFVGKVRKFFQHDNR